MDLRFEANAGSNVNVDVRCEQRLFAHNASHYFQEEADTNMKTDTDTVFSVNLSHDCLGNLKPAGEHAAVRMKGTCVQA